MPGLTAAVEAEYAVIKASQKQTASSSPTTAVPTVDLDTGRLLPRLLEVIDAERTYPQDRFQAQLPTDQDQELLQLNQPDGVSEWTRVCALKALYLRAYCLSRENKNVEALRVFQGALVSLSSVWSGQKGRAQLQFWAELLLTEYCMLQAQALERGDISLEDDGSLTPFRSWAKYWAVTKTQGAPLVGGHGFPGAVPRRRVWNEYYTAISSILQQDLPFPTGHSGNVVGESSARTQLQMELKKVETAYEALLLSETTFPRADEEREEVENFVAAVMRNWNVSVSRDWHEQDLGPGGKEGLSRGVLDILYRAATKTFHSTAILRYLFTVHLAVAEFDLAFHAFDSYMDIVKKGKARVDKTGHLEPSLDDDATVLTTISQAIVALCKYGFHDAAETARDLGVELEEMLQTLRPPLPNTSSNIPTVDEENGNGVVLHPRVPARVYALSWQAIGLSQAHWSRVTFDASARIDLQTKAIRSLQKSLSPEIGNPTDIRSLFTLSLLLAEQRELTAAIDIVKAALLSNKRTTEQRFETGSYWREISLIPLWHLLALLLSARQDYTMAARTCEAAFEQFNDPEVLFGSQTLQGSFRSEHLNEAEARNDRTHIHGLVDEMDDLEKEGIIEVKMTQLALLELLEGPEVAVNASQELLVLRSKMYSDARDAILEAKKLTDSLAVDISKDISGSVTPRNPGWGGKICLEELIGDVQAEMGLLAADEGTPYISRAYFEEALMHYPDHPSAIVGLSNILLDIYSEVLEPPPAIPSIAGEPAPGQTINGVAKAKVPTPPKNAASCLLLATPLGLGGGTHYSNVVSDNGRTKFPTQETSEPTTTDKLPAPYKADSLPLIDRLAARDRAYGLLSGLTKLGKGWNYSDAWFALARAHEESGQADKAKEALWWCVELEEGMGVRDWHCAGVNGYTL
ncbi:hypothetical protein ONZ43_g4795 [Nemania bipapillata]|uniref:Uncharacterized protein n=1 Tax=Nemania bipapillata TaxID=110536 RepID=A0ACC2II81_9PEZI|nr:hypothetical protein ONZ43_g4795 [Nemania bipapillata]